MKWKRRMRKVAAYLLLVIITVLTASLMVADENKEQLETTKAYYATDLFAGQADFLVKNVVSYLQGKGEIAIDTKMSDTDEVYRLLDYKGEKISKSTLPRQSEQITYKKLKQAGTNSQAMLEAAERGEDRGSDFYFFYENWKAQAFANLKYQFEKEETKNIHYFLKVTGKQYYDLLKKYTRKQIDKNEMQMVYYYKNKATGNYIKYNISADFSCFSLHAFEDDYDYSLDDVNRNKSFYFILDELDCSSEKSLEKSIITTPFTTVKATLASLALQQQIQEQENRIGSYNMQRLGDIDYTLETDTGDVIGNLQDTARKKQKYELLVSIDRTWGMDKKSRKRVENGTLKINDTIQNSMADWHVRKITIGVKKGVQFTKLKLWKTMYLLEKYKEIFEIIVLIAIIAFLILGGFIVRDTLQLPYNRYDKIAFEWRSIGSGMGALISLALVIQIVQNLYEYRDFAFLLIPVLLGVGAVFYSILLEYILSVIQNIHYKKVKENLVLFRIQKKLRMVCRSFCQNKNAAVRCGVFCGGYLLYNLFFGGILLAGLRQSDTLLSVVVLLALFLLLVGNAYVMYRVYQDMRAHDMIQQGVQRIIDGDLSYQIAEDTLHGRNRELACVINRIGEGLDKAVAVSIRDERLKAELITNVSHDIKTPLTSIINYVNLLKRENLTQEPVNGYIEVLDQKALRLKQLIEDLVEVSKASTGNLELECTNLNMTELLQQTMGEFEDKFAEQELLLLADVQQENMVVYADGRRMFRILENLFSNVCKYSMHHTRVYVSLKKKEGQIWFCIKNISKDALAVEPEELTQRFVRGEQSRTTEGSGLGLSIVKNLVELQNGEFNIAIDGDLFKATVIFPAVEMSAQEQE